MIEATKVAEEEVKYGKEASKNNLSKEELEKVLQDLETEMLQAATDLQFERAADLRDKIQSLRAQQK